MNVEDALTIKDILTIVEKRLDNNTTSRMENEKQIKCHITKGNLIPNWTNRG